MGTEEGEAMAEVIVFPKVPKAKITEETKNALELQTKMKRAEATLNLLLGSNTWDQYTFTTDDLHMLSLFGETMKFDPKVSARLIAKLAEFIARMSKTMLEMEEPY